VNHVPPAASKPSEPAGFYVCVGTRPEIIKMAPVVDALDRRGARPVIVHTGQHSDLAWPLYHYFGIQPAIALRREPGQGTLASLSAGILGSIDTVLAETAPRAILVHGDTTSAAMAALGAFYRGIPVAHVEAGLRSHHLDDPFPEEFNRSLIARIARWHFAPTEQAVRNLYREGVEPERTFLVGNTVVDATLRALARQRKATPTQAVTTGAAPSAEPGAAAIDNGLRTVLVTLHRRENWGATIAGIARAVFALIHAHDDMQVVWPLHANPELAQLIRDQMAQAAPSVRARCHLLAPLEYPDLIDVLSNAWLVITDSGGLQEEACSLKVPVLVTRQGTERPELIEAGAGRLVGTDPLNLIREFERIWRDPTRHAAMRCSRNPFGDGRASERIAAVLSEWLNEHSAAEHQTGLTCATRPRGSSRTGTGRARSPGEHAFESTWARQTQTADAAPVSLAPAAALLRPIGWPPTRESAGNVHPGVLRTPLP
jgi:UDP-N-acetylglucosamine 2-epimerase (non-hydrolysing)